MQLLDSFLSDFKEKGKNPIFWYYSLVYLVRHWEVIFALFNFDSHFKLENKIEFIKNHYENFSLFKDLTFNLFIAFLLLFISYLVIGASRFISSFYAGRIDTLIHSFNRSKKYIPKILFDDLEKKNQDLKEQLSSVENYAQLQRANYQNSESQIKLKNNEIKEINVALVSYKTKVEQIEDQLKNQEKELNLFKTEYAKSLERYNELKTYHSKTIRLVQQMTNRVTINKELRQSYDFSVNPDNAEIVQSIMNCIINNNLNELVKLSQKHTKLFQSLVDISALADEGNHKYTPLPTGLLIYDNMEIKKLQPPKSQHTIK